MRNLKFLPKILIIIFLFPFLTQTAHVSHQEDDEERHSETRVFNPVNMKTGIGGHFKTYEKPKIDVQEVARLSENARALAAVRNAFTLNPGFVALLPNRIVSKLVLIPNPKLDLDLQQSTHFFMQNLASTLLENGVRLDDPTLAQSISLVNFINATTAGSNASIRDQITNLVRLGVKIRNTDEILENTTERHAMAAGLFMRAADLMIALNDNEDDNLRAELYLNAGQIYSWSFMNAVEFEPKLSAYDKSKLVLTQFWERDDSVSHAMRPIAFRLLVKLIINGETL